MENGYSHGDGKGECEVRAPSQFGRGRGIPCRGSQVTIGAGIILAYPDTIPAHCYWIREGQILAVSQNPMGFEQVRYTFGSGQLVLAQYMLTGRRCGDLFRTSEKTTAVKICYTDLVRAMKNSFRVTLEVIEAIADYSEAVLKLTLAEPKTSAPVKVIDQLLALVAAHGIDAEGKILLPEKMTQQEMASLIGLHRVTVAKEVKKLKEYGLLVSECGCYRLPNLSALLAYRDSQNGGGR